MTLREFRQLLANYDQDDVVLIRSERSEAWEVGVVETVGQQWSGYYQGYPSSLREQESGSHNYRVVVLESAECG